MWASILASTCGLVRKLGSSAGASLPVGLVGVGVFGFVITISLFVLVARHLPCSPERGGQTAPLRQNVLWTQRIRRFIGRRNWRRRQLPWRGFERVEALFHVVH